MKELTPAELSEKEAREDNQRNRETKFILDLIDNFKMFIEGAMSEDMHADYDDHLEFIKVAFEAFEDFENDK